MNDWPPVTCLCPTYGRFQLLREALACFLAQDYPGEKRLLVLNDAPGPGIPASGPGLEEVFVVNHAPPFDNLGLKRQWLLEMTEGGHRGTPPLQSSMVCAHWDDDDLYLPWHLSRSVAALLDKELWQAWCASRGEDLDDRGWGCVKSRGAWYMTGRLSPLPSGEGKGEGLSVHDVHHNVFEGSMVFWRDEALALGGYPPLHSGQAKALMDAFAKAGRLFSIPDDYAPPSVDGSYVSYVYRWAQGCGHISPIGNKPDSLARFHAQNTDFGDGSPLTPGDLTPYWHALGLPNPQSPIENRE